MNRPAALHPGNITGDVHVEVVGYHPYNHCLGNPARKRPGPHAASMPTTAKSARLLAWLQEVGVPVNDPPPSLLPAEQVRYPQRRLAHLGGIVEPPCAAPDVNRIRNVLVNALQQVLAVKPALGVPGTSPVQPRLDRGRAPLVGAPAAEDHHIIPARPQALHRLGVALNILPPGVQELLGEFVPVRHASLFVRPSMPVGSCHRMTDP